MKIKILLISTISVGLLNAQKDFDLKSKYLTENIRINIERIDYLNVSKNLKRCVLEVNNIELIHKCNVNAINSLKKIKKEEIDELDYNSNKELKYKYIKKEVKIKKENNKLKTIDPEENQLQKMSKITIIGKPKNRTREELLLKGKMDQKKVLKKINKIYAQQKQKEKEKVELIKEKDTYSYIADNLVSCIQNTTDDGKLGLCNKEAQKELSLIDYTNDELEYNDNYN